MTWLFLILFQVNATESTPTLVQFYPSEVLRNEIVEFRPVDAHHFSFEAPQNCGTGSLNEKNPRTIKCQFTQSGPTQVLLNVCDDKKTYCRPIPLKINVADVEAGNVTALKKNEHINKELKKTLIAGFNEGTPQEVTANAHNQPVFVMVSTDWCPPCNESKEYLLPSEAFKSATQNWYKVYVDGDSVGAADWEKTVPYHYFPSFVLHNSRMEEIGRFNGELRQSEFVAWAKEQNEWLNDPIAKVKTRVLERTDGQWSRKIRDFVAGVSVEQQHQDEERLLKWALDQEDRGLITLLVAQGDYPALRSSILQYQISELERIGVEQKKDFKAEKIKLHQALLQETIHGEHWSTYLQSLCEVDALACRPYLAQISARLDYLTKDQSLKPSEQESRLGDEYYSITEIYRTLDEKVALKDFANACVNHFAAMQKTSALKISRAGNQGMVACLELSDDFQREEKALKTLMEAYPTEPTFLWRMARMRKKQKKFDDAIAWINKAEALAYGYNWFSLQALKAEVLINQKKTADAKRVVSETLAQIHLDPSTESRNQRLVAKLRALEMSSREVSKN
jgi:hypothetical protein